jgi:hypothetical protein
VRGSGTLVLTKDSDFTLPESRRHMDDRVAAERHVPVGEHVGGDVPGPGGHRRGSDEQGGDRREDTGGRCCGVGETAHGRGDAGVGGR